MVTESSQSPGKLSVFWKCSGVLLTIIACCVGAVITPRIWAANSLSFAGAVQAATPAAAVVGEHQEDTIRPTGSDHATPVHMPTSTSLPTIPRGKPQQQQQQQSTAADAVMRSSGASAADAGVRNSSQKVGASGWLANVKLCGWPIAITAENIVNGKGEVRNFLTQVFRGIKPKMTQDNKERMMNLPNLFPPSPDLQPDGKNRLLYDSCALVASGGRLVDSKFGEAIDSHSLVFRVNLGGAVLPSLRPQDVGKRTNIIVMGHRDSTPFMPARNRSDPEQHIPIDPAKCEKLLPSLMSGGPLKAKAPAEDGKPQFGLLMAGDSHMLRGILDCREHLVRIGREDDARKVQLIHPAIMYGMRKVLNLGKPSGGWMSFLVAMSLCSKIVPYGFGVVKGMPYHAYKWCDVDETFGIRTKDCPATTGGPNVKNPKYTETGFTSTNTFHDFRKEKLAMESENYNRPSDKCRDECKCK